MMWYDMVYSVSVVQIYYKAKFRVPSLKTGDLLLFQIWWYLVRKGIVWYSKVWYDIVTSLGVVQIYFNAKLGAFLADKQPSYFYFKFGGIWYDRVQFGIVWYGMTWYKWVVLSRGWGDKYFVIGDYGQKQLEIW